MTLRAPISLILLDSAFAAMLVAVPVGASALARGLPPTLFFGTGAVAFALSAMRAARVHLRFTDREIVVAYYFRTKTMQWDDVLAVTTGNAYAALVS